MRMLAGRCTVAVGRREELARRYLFGLQDATETLWHRLDNVAHEGGRLVTGDRYFEVTTLFALARALAAERVVALEGAYPKIDLSYPGLGQFLRKERVDLRLQGMGFHRYDRVALAEATMKRDGEGFRVRTYLEFRRRHEAEGSLEQGWLEPAKGAVRCMDAERMQTLLDLLREVSLRISRETGSPARCRSGPNNLSAPVALFGAR